MKKEFWTYITYKVETNQAFISLDFRRGEKDLLFLGVVWLLGFHWNGREIAFHFPKIQGEDRLDVFLDRNSNFPVF